MGWNERIEMTRVFLEATPEQLSKRFGSGFPLECAMAFWLRAAKARKPLYATGHAHAGVDILRIVWHFRPFSYPILPKFELPDMIGGWEFTSWRDHCSAPIHISYWCMIAELYDAEIANRICYGQKTYEF